MSWLLCVRRAAACGALAVMIPGLAIGGTLNPSSEYSISGVLNGDQSFASAAIGPTGGFLVWEDNSVSDLGRRINALRLDGSLHGFGQPFPVSSSLKSKKTGDQEKPQVAALIGGGAVFVWQGEEAATKKHNGKLAPQQIYARFLGPDGSFLTSDIRVSKFKKNNQLDPAVATLGDGSVVIVWAGFGLDGDRLGVFAEIFSSAGKKLVSEFQVNQFTANNQRTPSVAALPDGNFVITWISEMQRGPVNVDVYGRIFDSAGTPLINEFPINSSTSNLCANPSVAGSGNGFAVAWGQQDAAVLAAGNVFGVPVRETPTTRSTNSWDIYGRCFDLNGTAVTPTAQRLNTYTFGDQFAPKLGALGGNYLAVWTSLRQDGSWEGVFGQAFSENGNLVDSELPINVTTFSRQVQPAVTSNGLDRFLIVWSSFVASGQFDFDLIARTYLQP